MMEAVVMFLYLFLVIGQIVDVVYATSNPGINRFVLEEIFASRVEFVFAHPETFNHATLYTENKKVGDQKYSVVNFACMPYETGAKIANEYRGSREVIFKPLLVSADDDRMCFMIIERSPSRRLAGPNSYNYDNDARFHQIFSPFHLTPYPASLNIHENGYEMVESQLRTNHQLDLSNYEMQISFQTKVFSSVRDYKKHFQTVVDTLPTYDVDKMFGDFFWTAESTAKYFEEKLNSKEGGDEDDQFNRDFIRFKLWREIKLTFAHSQGADNSNEDDVEERRYTLHKAVQDDICFFDFLSRDIDITRDGIIKVPLRYLHKAPTPYKHECIAYLLAAFSKELSVTFIAVEKIPMLLNYRARSIQQTATVGSALSYQPYTAAGLRGDGQVITVVDSGVDSFSCYFYDPQGRVTPSLTSAPVFNTSYRKVIQYNYNKCGDTSDAEVGHGTHVSGIVAGNALGVDITKGAGTYDGVAPNAKISFSDFAVPGSGLCIPSSSHLYGPGYAAGARVQTHSWGNYFDGNGYYAGASTDSYLYNTQGMTVLFAAGNGGPPDRTITVESSAKNCLSIGSSQTTLGSDNITYIAFYSSKGPTYDGRLKPDVIAPGDQLNSARSSGTTNRSCATILMSGTSMASPAAAGVALLIRQYLSDSRFWAAVCRTSYRSCRAFIPSGVLVKAMLLHSAVGLYLYNGGDVDDIVLGTPPDYLQGYGRIRMDTMMPLKGSITGFDLFVADAVNIAEFSSMSYSVQIQNTNVPLKVTIAWYDPPNTQGTMTKALLHDLDLTVTSPSKTIYYGNRGRVPDAVNNNEKIVVNNPSVGIWQVNITSKALPYSGNQLFSIVITSNGYINYI